MRSIFISSLFISLLIVKISEVGSSSFVGTGYLYHIAGNTGNNSATFLAYSVIGLLYDTNCSAVLFSFEKYCCTLAS